MASANSYKQYINGQWVEPANGQQIEVFNPANDEVVGIVANGDKEDAMIALKAAKKAQKAWAEYLHVNVQN